MSDAADCAPLAPGARVGAWRVTGLIERDAFVCRYRADDGRRPAVLHELLPQAFVRRDGDAVQLRDPEDRSTLRWWLRNYLDKAAALGALGQPGLARVLDAFEAGGTGYCALEAVGDDSVAARVRQHGALDWHALLPALRPVLDALAAAHAQNLVIRDITPAQLVWRPDGALALAGFGPLRAPVRFRAQTISCTAPPAYAAPEELHAAGSVGPWTDVYALAASCAYALFGRVPPDATQRAATALRFALADPLPAALRAVLEASLAADGGERPQISTWLRAWPAPAAAPAAPPNPAAPENRGVPRLAIAAAVGAIAVGTAVWLSQRTDAPAPSPGPAPAATPQTAAGVPTPAAAPEPAPTTTAASAASSGAIGPDAVADAPPTNPRAAAEPSPAATPGTRPAAVVSEAPRDTPAGPAAAAAATAAAAIDPEAPSPEPEPEAAPPAATSAAPTPAVPDPAAEAERRRRVAAHLAQLEAEKAQCSTHVSDLFGGRAITYADLAAMRGVERLDDGRLRTPRLRTDDDRQVSLLVDTHGCVVDIRRY